MKLRPTVAALGAGSLIAIASASPSTAAPVRASSTGPVISQLTVGDTGNFSSLDEEKFLDTGDIEGSMEGLFTYGPNGQPKPQLVQFVSTPSLTTYVFHLRRGVEFWDGDEMTSADIVNAMDYYRQPKSEVSEEYADVKSVEATGPFTVVVTLAHPDASFEAGLCGDSNIFEKKFQEEHPTTMGDPGTLIMGTGAFEIDSWDPTTGIQLSANPHWWGGPVRVQHVSVKFFTNDTTEALAFRAGDLDVAFPANGSFAPTAGVKVNWVPSNYEGMFAMNVNVAPWDNIYVRRAVAYALDRPDLVQALGIPGEAVTSLIPPAELRVLGSQAQVNALVSSLPSYPYDLSKAKAEMALSPYPHGFTAPTDTIAFGTYTPETEVIAAELQKIGIKLNIKILTFSAWVQYDLGPKTYGNIYQAWGSGPDPSSLPSYILGHKNIASGEGNSADWDPPIVDTLMNEGLGTLNPAKRLAIYGSLLKLVATDIPYVPLFVQDTGLALSSKYTWPGFSWWSASGPWELDLRAG